MKNALKWGAICAAAVLFTSGAARAEGSDPLPIAANVWAGVGYDLSLLSGGNAGLDATGYVGGAFGADVGYRLLPTLSVVALGEYVPIFSSAAPSIWNVGGGLRFGSGPFAFNVLLAAHYSVLMSNGISFGGLGGKVALFIPIGLGIGPYVQVAYNLFSELGSSLHLLSANAGVSFSY